MLNTIVCNECGGDMQKGYVPDYMHLDTPTQPSWIEGNFEQNLFGFLKLRGKKRYQIVAYRCEQCGLIKFYAGPEPTLNK
ncbi:MAG: PF20097 family protein [Anaerolineales bacterium]